MATHSTQEIKRAGMTPAYTSAAAGGDRFTPGDRTFLHVKNGGGASITVTVPAPATVDGDLSLASLSVAVPAASEKMIGPLPAQLFTAHDGTGLGDVTYSGVTSVTLAVLDLEA